MARETVKLPLIRRDTRRTCQFRNQRFLMKSRSLQSSEGLKTATVCLKIRAASSEILFARPLGGLSDGQVQFDLNPKRESLMEVETGERQDRAHQRR